ncbi:MAG: anthranilate synthase component I [Candidatus Omnitrophica bacterium]|nr:anthranilate synthase component I [Candidatus Omnitrophota bacterium]
MYKPSLKEFLDLSKDANVIPVYKEIRADLDTPVSAYLKIKKDSYSFLLESVEGQEKIARYSFLGSRPSLVIKSKGAQVSISTRGKGTRSFACADPFEEIKKLMTSFRTVLVKGLPRFCGGLVGYIGYDMVRFFESLPDKNPDDLKNADAIFILADTMLVFDHFNHTIKIISNVILGGSNKALSNKDKTELYAQSLKKIEAIRRDLSTPLRQEGDYKQTVKAGIKISSNLEKKDFLNMVKKAKEYIKKGDIIQAVLSQRFKARVRKQPFAIYRNLRSLNPSPYMFFLHLDKIFLIGSSPEMLVRCEDGVVSTRPIAGTRPRGRDEKEDRFFAEQLLGDAKERSEHLMLVDLGRNDLGRVSKSGTVRVKEFMNIERYSHVMHLVSEVRGELKNDCDSYDTLRACFPAGTVSGSPKIRAMEIIDELENLRRGIYAGCVGYFSFSHNMDTCITIRTITISSGVAYVQAGAGIVADSIPEKEYTETVNKAKALLEAIAK